jgi:hypothetical protein
LDEEVLPYLLEVGVEIREIGEEFCAGLAEEDADDRIKLFEPRGFLSLV